MEFKGIEALYFAESESLCVLEVFVHINNDPELIHKYDLYRIDVPDELIVQLEMRISQTTGDHYQLVNKPMRMQTSFKGRKPCICSTSSSINDLPRDNNYAVNPNHPLMPEIFNIAEKLYFSFDQRNFK